MGGGEDDAGASYALKLARHVGFALEWVSRFFAIASLPNLGSGQGLGSSSNDHQSPVHLSLYMGEPGTRYRFSVQVLTMPES